MRGDRTQAYWNPKTELMPENDLRQLQFRKLSVIVRWAYHNSPLWRRKLDSAGVTPSQVGSLQELKRIPFLTKAEFLNSQKMWPPYGDILTVSPAMGIAYHQTSGTSGGSPLRVIETPRDWQWGADAWACGLYAFGLRADDVVYLPFGYGPFQGFWGVHYAVQKIGAMTIAGGAQPSERRIKQIIEMGATAAVTTPSYAVRLAQVAEGMGIDLSRESKVRILIHAGEPGASIPATKAMIEKAWGARAGDFAGMSESAGIFGFECSERPNGMHVTEDSFIAEVIEPETGRPLSYGEQGELVVTSFGKGSFPLIRYRTGDLVVKVPASSCHCGRSFDLFKGGILGRTDDMKLIRGTNVYPSSVEGVVRQFHEIREFQIVLTTVNFIDEITVRVEPRRREEMGREELLSRIGAALAEAHEGLRFNVEMVEPGALPTFELKAKRLIDDREKR